MSVQHEPVAHAQVSKVIPRTSGWAEFYLFAHEARIYAAAQQMQAERSRLAAQGEISRAMAQDEALPPREEVLEYYTRDLVQPAVEPYYEEAVQRHIAATERLLEYDTLDLFPCDMGRYQRTTSPYFAV